MNYPKPAPNKTLRFPRDGKPRLFSIHFPVSRRCAWDRSVIREWCNFRRSTKMGEIPVGWILMIGQNCLPQKTPAIWERDPTRHHLVRVHSCFRTRSIFWNWPSRRKKTGLAGWRQSKVWGRLRFCLHIYGPLTSDLHFAYTQLDPKTTLICPVIQLAWKKPGEYGTPQSAISLDAFWNVIQTDCQGVRHSVCLQILRKLVRLGWGFKSPPSTQTLKKISAFEYSKPCATISIVIQNPKSAIERLCQASIYTSPMPKAGSSIIDRIQAAPNWRVWRSERKESSQSDQGEKLKFRQFYKILVYDFPNLGFIKGRVRRQNKSLGGFLKWREHDFPPAVGNQLEDANFFWRTGFALQKTDRFLQKASDLRRKVSEIGSVEGRRISEVVAPAKLRI